MGGVSQSYSKSAYLVGVGSRDSVNTEELAWPTFLPCPHSQIPSRGSLVLKLDTQACVGGETEVNYLEHVQAVMTLNSTRRGEVEIFLNSPMGTR